MFDLQSNEHMKNRKDTIRIFAVNGFTLIELLVVLVILGMLAGLVGPRVMKYVGESKSKTARLQIEELAAAIDLYHLDVGNYPSTERGLQSLIEPPADLLPWRGPYLRKTTIPKDPWGYDYQYRSPGEHGPFDLLSLGADNKEGGSEENQDINSWE